MEAFFPDRALAGAGEPALLIDATGMSAEAVARIVAQARGIEAAGPARAFADWSDPALADTGRLLGALGIEARHHPATGAGGAAGIALAVEAIELVYTMRPRRMLIASAVADLTPLVARLRGHGVQVALLDGAAGDPPAAAPPAAPPLTVRTGRAVLLVPAPPSTPVGFAPAARSTLSAEDSRLADWIAAFVRTQADGDRPATIARISTYAAEDPTLDYRRGGGRLRRIVRTDPRFTVCADGRGGIVVSLAPVGRLPRQ